MCSHVPRRRYCDFLMFHTRPRQRQSAEKVVSGRRDAGSTAVVHLLMVVCPQIRHCLGLQRDPPSESCQKLHHAIVRFFLPKVGQPNGWICFGFLVFWYFCAQC